jgi:c-di-GMP-binding flagellar brake protein YcgR
MPLSNAPAPGPGKGEDRRAARRKPLHVTAVLRFAGAPPLQARTVDLSAGGLCLHSPVPLPERAACDLEFPLLLHAGVHRMQVRARVAYSVLSATEGFKTGLQFVGLSAEDQARLNEWLPR